MAKVTTVQLEYARPDGKVVSQQFNIKHAENLLAMKSNGGWRLPKDSTFAFDLSTGKLTKQTKKQVGRPKKNQ